MASQIHAILVLSQLAWNTERETLWVSSFASCASVLDKNQKFLTKIIRFINFIEEQFSCSEGYWNSLEVGMIDKSRNSAWEGLAFLLALTLRNHAFSLCLCFPICKKCLHLKIFFYINISAHKRQPTYEPSFMHRAPFPARCEGEVSSLRPFTMSQ